MSEGREQARNEQDVNREVERRLEEISLLRDVAQQQGLAFSGLSEEVLVRKVRRESSSSPYIYAQGWTSTVGPGATASYSVYISNPDPSGYYPMFVSIFFGAANFLDDVGEGLSGRDTRWPYLSSRAFVLAGNGATTTQNFSYTAPTGVPLSTYLGNSVLWRGDFHDKGAYLDRGLFYVNLS